MPVNPSAEKSRGKCGALFDILAAFLRGEIRTDGRLGMPSRPKLISASTLTSRSGKYYHYCSKIHTACKRRCVHLGAFSLCAFVSACGRAIQSAWKRKCALFYACEAVSATLEMGAKQEFPH